MSLLRYFLQNVNVGGTKQFVKVLTDDPQLAIPHISVDCISQVDWHALQTAGFRGVVLDVDNTLTVPYETKISTPEIQESIDRCKEAFGEQIVLYSNSAGLAQFDPEGQKATQLEDSLQLRVMRHKAKKPEVDPLEFKAQFGFSPEQLVVVGDRIMTDIVLGNRLSAATVLTQAIDSSKDPMSVKVIRPIETQILNRFRQRGLLAKRHSLISHSATYQIKLAG